MIKVNWFGAVKCAVCKEPAILFDLGGKPTCGEKTCIDLRTKEIAKEIEEFEKLYKH